MRLNSYRMGGGGAAAPPIWIVHPNYITGGGPEAGLKQPFSPTVWGSGKGYGDYKKRCEALTG